MDDLGLGYLKKLLETPSPSGYEQAIQGVVREHLSGSAALRTDTHGNVFATHPAAGPVSAAPRIMLAGHCDQIGLATASCSSSPSAGGTCRSCSAST